MTAPIHVEPTTGEILALPLDDEADALFDELAGIAYAADLGPDPDGENREEQLHRERLERALADSARMMFGAARSIVRARARLQALQDQQDAIVREFARAREPLEARVAQAEAYLERLVLMQRELDPKATVLPIPGYGKVTTRRQPGRFTFNAEALLPSLPADTLETYAPFEQPKEPQRRLDTKAFQAFLEAQAEQERAESWTAEQLAAFRKLPADEQERVSAELMAEIAAGYTGVTYVPAEVRPKVEIGAQP